MGIGFVQFLGESQGLLCFLPGNLYRASCLNKYQVWLPLHDLYRVGVQLCTIIFPRLAGVTEKRAAQDVQYVVEQDRMKPVHPQRFHGVVWWTWRLANSACCPAPRARHAGQSSTAAAAESPRIARLHCRDCDAPWNACL